MRNMNSTSEDKDHTLIRLSIWIRRNAVSDTQNQYTGSQNQMMKYKALEHKDQEGVHPPNKQRQVPRIR